MNKPRAVIFDMGNVLIGWDPHEAYRHHLPDADERLAFLGHYFRLMYDAVHDDPRPMSECLAPLKEEYPELRHLIEVYERQWHLFLSGPIAESVVLVDRLYERGVPLYGLTNWPHQVWPPHDVAGVADPVAYGFLDKFNDIVVSGRERMRKPEPQIYDLALLRFSLEPSEAVFVDDLLENVEAAQAHGLHGIHFTDAAALEVELVGFGLL